MFYNPSTHVSSLSSQVWPDFPLVCSLSVVPGSHSFAMYLVYILLSCTWYTFSCHVLGIRSLAMYLVHIILPGTWYTFSCHVLDSHSFDKYVVTFSCQEYNSYSFAVTLMLIFL